MSHNIRVLNDSELNIVSGGGCNIQRSQSAAFGAIGTKNTNCRSPSVTNGGGDSFADGEMGFGNISFQSGQDCGGAFAPGTFNTDGPM